MSNTVMGNLYSCNDSMYNWIGFGDYILDGSVVKYRSVFPFVNGVANLTHPRNHVLR
jgi:hypothetical protein